MKVVTWNVNGIRARHEQVRELIDREQPDVLCLQELKATREQVPDTICEHPRYWCYWHGARAYSGVGLHVSKERAGEAPRITHPAFDHETRIAEAELGDVVLASVYVPNGGKDYAAKMAFLESLEGYVASVHERGRRLVLCGDINIALEERDVHPKERKPNAIGQRPDERAAVHATARARPGGRRARPRPRQRRALHLVGAVAQPAPAEHRLAARLRPRQRRGGAVCLVVREPP